MRAKAFGTSWRRWQAGSLARSLAVTCCCGVFALSDASKHGLFSRDLIRQRPIYSVSAERFLPDKSFKTTCSFPGSLLVIYLICS